MSFPKSPSASEAKISYAAVANVPQKLRSLYPLQDAYDEGKLSVSKVHTLHYEQSGNPNGKPALVVHGGPGGGCPPFYRRFFDPEAYRIVMFDQRGAGKSTPSANLEENTTWDLVADIEKLRKHLKIEKWHVVFGGSWGSTLSLAYAEKHPAMVNALVLRGIFTLREEELLWFYQKGASFVYPDAWEKYIAPIPSVERGHLMSAYHRRLTGTNRKEQLECARAWSLWEMSTSRLYVDPESLAKAEDDEFALAFARIECHYFVNGGFFEEDGQLIKRAGILKNIPGVVVQGRYDMVCPAKSAWDLHKVWGKNCDLKIISDAGHSCKEPGIIDALVKATDRFR